VIVDGFDSLTAVQQQVLRIMAQQVRELVITFPGQIGSTRPAHRRFTPRIERLQQELSPTIVTLHALPHLPPVVAHIESQLLEIACHENSTAQPILLEARSPAEEAREALRWMKRLVVRARCSPVGVCFIHTRPSNIPSLPASCRSRIWDSAALHAGRTPGSIACHHSPAQFTGPA
jgi:hypothetical protein